MKIYLPLLITDEQYKLFYFYSHQHFKESMVTDRRASQSSAKQSFKIPENQNALNNDYRKAISPSD